MSALTKSNNKAKYMNNGSTDDANVKNDADNNNVLFALKCRTFAILCLFIPLLTMFICLITSMKYQFEEVNEDKCNVTNYLPSISAIMGVYPQCYAWRIVMALQCTPRFAVGFAYTSLWKKYLPNVPADKKFLYVMLYKVCAVLYFIEMCTSIGTAYISNKDNYPIHEKLFVLFLMVSIFYQIFTLVLFRIIHPDVTKFTKMQKKSYRIKFITCTVMCVSVTILSFAYAMHRFYCDPRAFSIFAGMEYFIAISNMVYHFTGAYDVPEMSFTISGPMFDGIKPVDAGLASQGDNRPKFSGDNKVKSQ